MSKMYHDYTATLFAFRMNDKFYFDINMIQSLG